LVALDDTVTAALIAAAGPEPLNGIVSGGQAAYVMYTSGSTGRPKGVAVTHDGLASYLAGVMTRLGIDERGRGFALLQPAATDFGNTVLFASLVSGGTLHILDADTTVDAGALARYLADHAIDYMKIVPSHLAALEAQRGLDGLLPSRALVMGGEAAPPGLVDAVLEAAGDSVAIVNHYGPTETTVGVVATRLTDPSAPIGRPLPSARVHVLDQHLTRVPVGVPGELFAAGAGVARGYLGRPELTAERFVADPFAADGSRMYRTGDRVRWRADGRLEFLGRADHQMKVRGYRVEPGEVEAALCAHPAVAAAVVTAHKEGLAAYLVPDDPETGLPPIGELRAYLHRSLPDHMIPSAVVELAALPLTANGKLDRAALPAPGETHALDGHLAPRSACEELLAGIWCEVLGLGRVGVADNFFELGGHSLLATQVVSRIRAVFGVEVPLSVLFDRPTVAELAAAVDGQGESVSGPGIVRVARGDVLPLSFAQQRLWFLQRLEPESSEYNVPMPLRLTGDLDVAALEAALTSLVERHEVLRTRLVPGPDGMPFQVIDAPGRFRLAEVEADEEAAGELLATDASTPFDLAEGPLIRGTLIRLAADEHILALCLHHVVTDQWSGEVLLRELTDLYQAHHRGTASSLQPLDLQYADFAVWQREWLSGEVLEGRLDYWRRRLAGAPVLDLPTDRPYPAERSSEGAVVSFQVSEAMAERLRGLSRTAGATMFMTLFSAYALLLGRYSGQDDIVAGTLIAGRDRAEVEDLIGFFVNTLVLRTDLSGDPTFGDVVARVRRQALDAYAHQDLPFEQLVDALAVERDRSRSPLFQVLFNYAQVRGDGTVRLGDLHVAPLALTRHTTPYDLTLTVVETEGEGLAGAIEYRTDVFDDDTARRMARHYTLLLESVTADGHVADLPIVTPAERDALAGGAPLDLPAAAGVHELIEARAAESPDAVAVVTDGASLSYAELIERADRLAGRLRAHGVGPESVVALCLERGPDLVAALLAVWRAGGAYLPLDPDYPAERLEFMLADSRASVLLGHRSVAGAVARSVDVWLDDPDPDPASAALEEPRGGQLASVIYTSGSTGRPKGVQVTHAGLIGVYAAWASSHFPRGRHRWLSLTNVSFDVFTADVVRALCSGGTLVLGDPGLQISTPEWADLMRRHRVNALECAPRYADALVDHLEATGGALPDLRLLVVTTDVWRTDGAARARRVLGCRVLTAYGITETTIDSTFGDMAEQTEGRDRPAPIGRPLPGTRMYVLDRSLNPVPIGATGEVFIGGSGLSRGYLHRPVLTAERFVADPFGPAGERLYRTGDRARWLADGRLEFLGRGDEQLKVRGYRIEPGEVEACLRTHPSVDSALVVARGERLVGYLVTGAPPSTAELRAHLARSLPDFMIPSVFVAMDAFPLTANGKLDPSALPAPGTGTGSTEYRPPRTETEEAVAGVWAEILGVERVGVDDDFFELGGHSLLAIQVTARMNATFGVDLALRAVFDTPTVAGVAELVEARIWEEIEQMSEDDVLRSLEIHAHRENNDEDGVSR
jgi:amino acid adenylation domain-containing protein